MAKTLIKEEISSSSNGNKKQRKKQARQEAKTMLKLEQAKKDEQKAEKRFAKAQAELEVRRTNTRNIEAKLAEGRNSQHKSEVDVSATGSDGQGEQPGTEESSQGDTDNSAHISTPTNQVTSLPPAEGRTDIDPEEV